jgi:hypothetical protein
MTFPIIFYTFTTTSNTKFFNNMSLRMFLGVPYFIQVKEAKMSLQAKDGQLSH